MNFEEKIVLASLFSDGNYLRIEDFLVNAQNFKLVNYHHEFTLIRLKIRPLVEPAPMRKAQFHISNTKWPILLIIQFFKMHHRFCNSVLSHIEEREREMLAL